MTMTKWSIVNCENDDYRGYDQLPFDNDDYDENVQCKNNLMILMKMIMCYMIKKYDNDEHEPCFIICTRLLCWRLAMLMCM